MALTMSKRWYTSNSIVGVGCFQPWSQWLQYEHGANNASFVDAGFGYVGWDTRVKRAYAFDDLSVWYFDGGMYIIVHIIYEFMLCVDRIWSENI